VDEGMEGYEIRDDTRKGFAWINLQHRIKKIDKKLPEFFGRESLKTGFRHSIGLGFITTQKLQSQNLNLVVYLTIITVIKSTMLKADKIKIVM
jgi:hypothetical protein